MANSLSKKKKPKVKDNRYWRKRACELAKKIARAKAGYKCAHCGLGEPNRITHGSHIYAEGKNPNMSVDVDNILCLCWLCHMGGLHYVSATRWSWHGTPAEAMEWFQEKYPELHQTLKIRSQQVYKVDFEKKYLELKDIWGKLQTK